ncbi:hypothetical protein QLQ12_40280 [Actinoplanes sp. NEAU-A12]|uniref:Uncharacterized protein n=1 Tax=Actinoplanes sandaracinus TaxID=3045177 RepID=A0ABT6WYM8_9ACTN|nr:hypothetical protein [Actinoplanes sandaracinus]MDI6104843.1 hypothetical protein [Actinoplanes sandaracinus]
MKFVASAAVLAALLALGAAGAWQPAPRGWLSADGPIAGAGNQTGVVIGGDTGSGNEGGIGGGGGDDDDSAWGG